MPIQVASLVYCNCLCGSGKSTISDYLMFELGGISERRMQQIRDEADNLDMGYFTFYMNRQQEERTRGSFLVYTVKEFYTDRYHYFFVDPPGHRDFIKKMITGVSQADVAVLVVSADGNLATDVAKGGHKTSEVRTRQHARLMNLLGVNQIIVCINKMDCDLAKYGKERYEQVRNEVRDCLIEVGWQEGFVMQQVPCIPHLELVG